MEHKELAVDVCRLNNFLVNNQLVQANAIAQRLESNFQAEIISSSSLGETEKENAFAMFRKAHMVRTCVLAGKRDEALSITHEIADMLPKGGKAE